jgi:hypothetical protein
MISPSRSVPPGNIFSSTVSSGKKSQTPFRKENSKEAFSLEGRTVHTYLS